MKPQKSIIKDLKTYEHDLYSTRGPSKRFKIDDFPHTSRKPIEWQDCDQFIKLRQLKCKKKTAMSLCQQFKIHRADTQFLNTLHNVSTSNNLFKKISASASFLLRKIKQKQVDKQQVRLEFQDSQVDTKMSSILDDSFQKFQRSLDMHLDEDRTHTFNLKELTREQLLKKLKRINQVSKLKEEKYHLSQHNTNQPTPLNSIHHAQTERRYSKQFTPSRGQMEKYNFSQQLIHLNSKSNRSLMAFRKQSEDKRPQKPEKSIHSHIRSMQYIKKHNELMQLKNDHKRQLTNFDYFQSSAGFQ